MKIRSVLYLLLFPIALMGAVHLGFATLSAVVFNDHVEAAFYYPALAILLGVLAMLVLLRGFDASKLGYREALLYAVLTWIAMGLAGAVPIASITHVSLVDAVFESVSGLTTTGATILSGLDALPPSFLLYRQFLQWLGGLGIVIFVVAVLPMLNVGGMRLLRAEVSGPMKDDKLSPRVAGATRALWGVYLMLTALCALCYYLAGMDIYDAVAHSFTTISTGGFSTHDASMGYFDSSAILWVSNLFMLLGAISFALHYRIWRARHWTLYWQDEETRAFLVVVAVMGLIITGILYFHEKSGDIVQSLNLSVFHLISFITSTGYGAGNYVEWPLVLVFLLVVAGYLGGCAGSTAGGNKFVRNIIMLKMVRREFLRMLHPKGIFTVKYQSRSIEASVISASMAFITLSTFTTIVITLLLMTTGLDLLSALTATAACINVSGPAFGELGSNFQPVSDAGTWILSGAMILGRLEYFTVLALLLPSYWKG